MLNTLVKLFGYGCIYCGKAVRGKSEILCSHCEYRLKYYPPSDSSLIVSAISYRTEQARKLIHYMKDNNDPYVFDYAASLIEEKLREVELYDKLADFYITYAPRNPITFIKKRFDQSKEIADFLAVRLFDDDTDRVVSLFKRYPFADEQKKLGSAGRAENVRGLFSLKENVPIPEKLIVVDDVTTTGSTLLVLRDLVFRAGVKECVLCTVAVNDRYVDHY